MLSDIIKKQYPVLGKYEAMLERVEVPAKTVLLREGDISRRSFFVEQGCLRVYFNNRGVEMTFQFFFEGQLVSSADSFVRGIPSVYSIETIEPAVLYVLNKEDFLQIEREVREDVGVLNELVGFLFDRQMYYAQEFMSLIRDTPTERYVRLLKEKPHIEKRVAQHYIASYLGITAVSLSRIRSKVFRRDIS